MPSTYRSAITLSIFTEGDRRSCERPYATVADLLPSDYLLVYCIAFTREEAGSYFVFDTGETG